MRGCFHTLLLLGCVLILSACSSALRWTPDYHTVRGGETLYSIARDYNLDYRSLAAWNELGDGTRIREGQKIRLSAPSGKAVSRKPAAPVVPAPKWLSPTAGNVYLKFGQSQKTQSGIRIAGQKGQKIFAAAGGEVVYAGDGLNSYGQLLIIKHNQTWLSAYGFNEKLRVREGQQVTANQHVADMGTDSAGKAVLHFEIRRNGTPVDPLASLPPR